MSFGSVETLYFFTFTRYSPVVAVLRGIQRGSSRGIF